MSTFFLSFIYIFIYIWTTLIVRQINGTGMRKPYEHNTKIIGGQEVQPGEFPYQIFVEKIWNSTKIYKCGGVVYNSQYVLTSAHCLFFRDRNEFASPHKIWITAGTHDLASMDPEIRKFEQVIKGKEIYPHPQFEFKKGEGQKNNFPVFDIALIKLYKPLMFNERVQSIPIADKNYIERGNGTVTGFGRPQANGRWTKRMRKVDIPLVNWKSCLKVFKGAAIINKDMFCTGTSDGQVTPCNGDSGGPIVCNSSGNRVLCGISSFGAKDCANYSVYTRVASYFDWIRSVAGDQQI